MPLTLYIGNKSYSSWSMRPWMLLESFGIPFEEVVIPLYVDGSKETILCLEYWCYDEDQIWQEASETLVEIATREIGATGLVRREQVKKGHVVRVPRCYPVYARNYRAALGPVEQFLSGVPGITPIGRYGAFKYNNQDHSILMGLLAAENIAGGARHDLWSLSTDYECQEACRITATGLQPA